MYLTQGHEDIDGFDYWCAKHQGWAPLTDDYCRYCGTALHTNMQLTLEDTA